MRRNSSATVRRLVFMPLRLLFALAATLLVALTAPVGAAEQTFVAQYRDWSLFTYTDGDQKLCFVASEPARQDGNYERRGAPAVLVTRLPSEPELDEVSVQPGYTYAQDSDVEIVVDGEARFSLFTRGEYAWTRGPADDDALIAAMRAGLQMTVRGTSTRGTYSLDTYSLLGFTAAMTAMDRACRP
jgi:hypothetical protein